MLSFLLGRGNGRTRDARGARTDPAEPLYTLRPREEPLLRAAIELGDWILAQRGLSRGQRKAVVALQEALRVVPGTPPPVIAEYGFHARYEPAEGKGLYRAWRVSLSPGGLEIYSVYSPDEKIEFEDKVSHELNFWQRPSRPVTHDGYFYEQWIEDVGDPDRFRKAATIFGFMAEFEMGEY